MGKGKSTCQKLWKLQRKLLGKQQRRSAKAKDTLGKAKDTAVAKVASTLDANGDGTIDIQDVIILAVKTPAVHISRDKFLRKELFKNYPPGSRGRCGAQNTGACRNSGGGDQQNSG